MTLTRSILAIAFAAVAQHALLTEALAQGAPDLEAILANPKIVKSLDDIKADDERTFAEQKRITEIPAPPFKEKVRAEYYQKRMQELGIKHAEFYSKHIPPDSPPEKLKEILKLCKEYGIAPVGFAATPQLAPRPVAGIAPLYPARGSERPATPPVPVARLSRTELSEVSLLGSVPVAAA